MGLVSVGLVGALKRGFEKGVGIAKIGRFVEIVGKVRAVRTDLCGSHSTWEWLEWAVIRPIRSIRHVGTRDCTRNDFSRANFSCCTAVIAWVQICEDCAERGIGRV